MKQLISFIYFPPLFPLRPPSSRLWFPGPDLANNLPASVPAPSQLP